VTAIDRSAPAAMAAEFGLTPIGRQPALKAYMQALWERRFFIWTFARSRIAAENAESRLGQLWQVLNPLLNAGVYYLVFGVILGQSKKIEHYIAFLLTGVFIFAFSSRTIMAGSRSISGNLGLVRALHFPRAVLPFANVIEELVKTGTSLIVLAVLVVLTGEAPTAQWFLLLPVILLQLMFSAGIALVFARLTAEIRDVAQFLPFALRIWMYLSGVMYLISDFVKNHDGHPIVTILLEVNPAAVYIQLARNALMNTAQTNTPVWNWYLALAWAIVPLIGGFIFFWRAESRYGRG